jgi:hypothetical protein
MQHQESRPTAEEDEEVIYSSSPAPPLDNEFEKDMDENEDHEKARDTSLPLSEVNRKLSNTYFGRNGT